MKWLEQRRHKLWHILSPVQGHVLRVLQESTGVVAAGTPLLELADAADLEVVVDVLTTDAVQIPLAGPCTSRALGLDQPLPGRVRVVEPGAFTKVSALGVEAQRVNVVIDLVSPFPNGRRLETTIVLRHVFSCTAATMSSKCRPVPCFANTSSGWSSSWSKTAAPRNVPYS